MEGDLDGKAAQSAAGEEGQGEQALREGHKDAQADGAQEVAGGDGNGGSADYKKALATKDAEIEALQAKVAEAAKTAEATEALGKEIADLKARLADERTEFALRSAGARSVTAAKALLAEHDGDVAALVKAEPWLFDAGRSGKGGATGLEPAGASGGSDDQYMKRWERIAGLTDEGKEG
jgi:hypothetical protein